MSIDVGSISKIYFERRFEPFVLQVMEIKPIQNTPDRWRMVLSDSIHYQQALLATQNAELARAGKISKGCFVRLLEFVCNEVQNKKIIIVLRLEVIGGPQPILGSPINIAGVANPGNTAPQQKPQTMVRQNTAPPPSSSSSNAPSIIHPIKSLNPYQQRWTIKARVTAKSDVRTWEKPNSSGKLFSVDLLDSDGGEIRATMFNEAVDKFYDLFEINNVYYISKGYLKAANKKFSSIKNEYEISLDPNSIVELCNEVTSIPKMNYNFVSLDQIQEIEKDSIIDIIGIVVETGELTQITTKAGKELIKRSFTVLDTSSRTIDMTLWGSSAENIKWSQNDNPVVAIKGAKVSDFNNKTLTSVSSTSIEVNPDVREAHQLSGWYQSQGGQINLFPLSQQQMGGGATPKVDKVKFFTQIKDEGLGREKPDYFVTKGTITMIKHDNPVWYNACPQPDCNKKVLPINGMWRCEKCNMNHTTYDPRYIMSFNAGDHTGSSWLSCFNDVATIILGKTAKEMEQLQDQDPQQYEAIFQQATFKPYVFKIRAKEEMYNGEARVKCSVMSCHPIDFVKETNSLLEQIQQLSM